VGQPPFRLSLRSRSISAANDDLAGEHGDFDLFTAGGSGLAEGSSSVGSRLSELADAWLVTLPELLEAQLRKVGGRSVE